MANVMTTNLPVILTGPQTLAVPPSPHELSLLAEARQLYDGGFHPYALLAMWNAAVHNLRRRVEAYGTDLWLSVVKDENGRKKFDKDGETIAERWSGVDDLVLITGASRLGLIDKKGGKALEMINWNRNHASPAHDSDNAVTDVDVMALAMLLQVNLFNKPMPDPGHSIAGLFEPVKTIALDAVQVQTLTDQINALTVSDLRNAFGFLMDMLAAGVPPATQNAATLLPVAWERASEDLRKAAGLRYQNVVIDPASDTSPDKATQTRLIDLLTRVKGVNYIPDAARARLYRHAASLLAQAKNSSYGWAAEETAARTLAQFGPWVPSIAFDEVYQEIVAVYCGNFWGASGAGAILDDFITSLNTDQVRRLIQIIATNERAKAELFSTKPKLMAVHLLGVLKAKLTINAHLVEADQAIAAVEAM